MNLLSLNSTEQSKHDRFKARKSKSNEYNQIFNKESKRDSIQNILKDSFNNEIISKLSSLSEESVTESEEKNSTKMNSKTETNQVMSTTDTALDLLMNSNKDQSNKCIKDFYNQKSIRAIITPNAKQLPKILAQSSDPFEKKSKELPNIKIK